MPTIEFYVHKVQKNDTLLSVAKRLQIHPIDLKYFHNERSKASERIIFDHLRGIKKLLIPIDYKYNLLRNTEKSNKLPNIYFEKSFYKNEYQITEIVSDNQQKQQIVSYKILLNFEEKDEKTIIKLHRKDFRRNGKIPDEKLYHLSNKVQQILSPLQFIVDEKGLPTTFYKLDKMVENFREKRSEIEEDFIGDLTKNYLDTIEFNLSNAEYLCKQYTSSLLFETLFPNKKIFQIENIFHKKFYFVPNSFEVNCKCEAFYNHGSKQIVETTIKGNTIEHYTLDEVVNGIKSDDKNKNTSFDATLCFEYKTDKRTKRLEEATAEIKLFDHEKEFKTYQLIIK